MGSHAIGNILAMANYYVDKKGWFGLGRGMGFSIILKFLNEFNGQLSLHN